MEGSLSILVKLALSSMLWVRRQWLYFPCLLVKDPMVLFNSVFFLKLKKVTFYMTVKWKIYYHNLHCTTVHIGPLLTITLHAWNRSILHRDGGNK